MNGKHAAWHGAHVVHCLPLTDGRRHVHFPIKTSAKYTSFMSSRDYLTGHREIPLLRHGCISCNTRAPIAGSARGYPDNRLVDDSIHRVQRSRRNLLPKSIFARKSVENETEFFHRERLMRYTLCVILIRFHAAV
jgi:hypothetical protein